MDFDGEPCPQCPDTSRPASLAEALARCEQCLARDGVRIDRGHVEVVLLEFGEHVMPLDARIAGRAIAARPELAGAGQLVAPVDAVLVRAAENWQARLDRLVEMQAPDIIIEHTRLELANAAAREERLEWERVSVWPAPGVGAGTVAFGELARFLAAIAVPGLLGDDHPDVASLLDAIDDAANTLVVADAALARRHAWATAADVAREPAHARALELSVRFLDELGHTDLRDNQDTLLDDCYFALERHGRTDLARDLYRRWLREGVPRAVAAITAGASHRT